MATRAEYSIVINQPVHKVYAYISDARNNPKWQIGVVDTRIMPDGPPHVGTKVTDAHNLAGRRIEVTYEVTELEPTRKIAVKSISGPLLFKGTTTFEPVGDGTRVTAVFEMEATGFLKLAGGLVINNLKKDFESSFNKLKEILDSQA